MNYNPKVLVVSNSSTKESFWEFSPKENNIELVIEPNPNNILQHSLNEVPNLIVVDIIDQEQSIFKIIKIHKGDSEIPILFLTQNKPEEYIMQAYDAGVDECVIKPISPLLFHAKIKAWLRRSWFVPINIFDPIKVGRVNLIPRERVVVIDNRDPIRLTSLELRLLYVLMRRPGRTISAEELIQKVWGYGKVADNTVLKNSIYRLRKKIEMDPMTPRIIQTVARTGYRLVSE
jgi:DNA-binding response OmpR family regulator